MRISELPEVFGIVRTQATRGPCIQLCTAEYIERHSNRSTDGLDYHIVQNAHPRYMEHVDIQFEISRNNPYHHLHCTRYKHPITSQLQEVYCWFLPFRLMRNDRAIPILDFQYRSWLPTNYDPLPIDVHVQGVKRIVEDTQQDKLREIQQLEDSESEPHVPWHRYSYQQGSETAMERSYRSRNRRDSLRYPIRIPSPPPPPPARIVHVEVPVERVVVQTRSQPLPKAVGDVLLANARQGSESCPIAAVPFKECSTICVTSCFHIFDSESLSRWQTDHSSCPVCRTKIENVVSE